MATLVPLKVQGLVEVLGASFEVSLPARTSEASETTPLKNRTLAQAGPY